MSHKVACRLAVLCLPILSAACGGGATREEPSPAVALAEAGACTGSFELRVAVEGLAHLDAKRQASSDEFWILFLQPTNRALRDREIDLPAHATTLSFDPDQVEVQGLATRSCHEPSESCREIVLDNLHMEIEGFSGPVTADWTRDPKSPTSLAWVLDSDRLVSSTFPQATKDLSGLRGVTYGGDVLNARLRGIGGHLRTGRLWVEDEISRKASSFRLRGLDDEEPIHLARLIEWSDDVRGCATVQLTDLASGASVGSLRVRGGGRSLARLTIGNHPTEPHENRNHLHAVYSLYELPEQIDPVQLVVLESVILGDTTGDDAQCSPSSGDKKP